MEEKETLHDRNEGIGEIKPNYYPNIFICGLSGSGKDTISNILVDKFGYLKVRIADTIKRIIMEKRNLTFDELEEQKRINPELREEHFEVGRDMDICEGTKNRINQIINRTSLDIYNLPKELQTKKMVVIDCRSYTEAKTFLDAGYYGIFLSRKPTEYTNESHWTEKNMFENGEVNKLISEYKHKIVLVLNDKNYDYYEIEEIAKKITENYNNTEKKNIILLPSQDNFKEDITNILYNIFTYFYEYEIKLLTNG